MRTTYTFLLCCFASAALAQGSADYYRPREAPKRSYDRLLVRYGSSLSGRWYVGAEGFVRVDNSRLSTSFGGLVVGNPVTRPGWSALVGWTSRNAWAVEAGYARSPIHNELAIHPSVYRYNNEKNGFLLRGKRQLFSTSPQEHRSGVWVSTGLWLIPNSGQTREQLTLEGRGYRWYQRDMDRPVITTETATNTRATGLAELGLEYAVRLSSRVDMGIYARKYWGLGSSITTDLSYAIDGRTPQTANLQGRGNGASFGVALRYTLSRSQLIARTSVYDLRGNRPASGKSRLKP